MTSCYTCRSLDKTFILRKCKVYFTKSNTFTMSNTSKTYAMAVSGKTEREEWKDGEPGEPVLNPLKMGFIYRNLKEQVRTGENAVRKSPRKRSGYMRMKANLESKTTDLDWDSDDSVVYISSTENSPVKKKKRLVLPLMPDSSDSENEFLDPIIHTKRRILIENSESDNDWQLEKEEENTSMETTGIQNEIELFNDQDLLPIYRRLSKGIDSKEAAQIIISKDPVDENVARTVPVGVQENCIFIVDLETIGHWKNLLADDNGMWRQTGTRKKFININDEHCSISSKQTGLTTHALIRYPYVNGSSKDFHRTIIILEDVLTKLVSRLGIVQYYFEGEEHPIKILPHGNSKSDRPFIKTMETTKNSIKKQSEIETPKRIFYNIIDSIGGVDAIKSCGQKPRDLQQIKNYRRQSSEDDVVAVVDLSKGEYSDFIRKVTLTPEFSVVLCSDQQLTDIERFCTNPKEFCVLGVDTTFNIGNFYVTLTTYRHLHLLSKQNVHPVMIGPVLIHQRRLYDSFVQLPSTMVELKPSLVNIMCIGTDGEKNIFSVFENTMRGTKHLLCDIHMRDNIKHKLTDLAIEKETKSKIMKSIFGTQVGDTKYKGLVDCTDLSNFDKQLEEFINQWIEESPTDETRKKVKGFSEYFKKHKADLIKTTMSAEIRSQCGLGMPPNPFTQNANECMNKIIKVKNPGERSKLSPSAFIKKLQSIIRRQEDDTVLAMLGQGELKLVEKYKFLQVEEMKFYRMNRDQKLHTKTKFLTASVICEDEMIQRNTNHSDDEDDKELSVTPEQSGINNIPYEILKSMFKKASKLLSSNIDIIKAPGKHTDMYFVTSASSNIPHTIKIGKTENDISCDRNCFRFCSYKICSHVIAVADHCGKLRSFCERYRSGATKQTQRPNLAAASTFGMPSNRGQKPVKSTQKRKGPNREPIATYADCTISESEPTKNIGRPNPLIGSYLLTLLQFCDSKVSKCYGCKGLLREHGNVPKPPNDLIVVTKCYREFIKDGVRKTSNIPTNVYFHLQIACIKFQNDNFFPGQIYVPPELFKHLQDIHKSVLHLLDIQY